MGQPTSRPMQSWRSTRNTRKDDVLQGSILVYGLYSQRRILALELLWRSKVHSIRIPPSCGRLVYPWLLLNNRCNIKYDGCSNKVCKRLKLKTTYNQQKKALFQNANFFHALSSLGYARAATGYRKVWPYLFCTSILIF